MTENQPSLPALSGVRVLEFGLYAAVPYAASILGDMGADVIKIEPPRGDPFRHVDNDVAPGQSAYFYGVNRSKRSLVLDLGAPGAEPVLRELLAGADIVLVSYRPEVVRRLGLDFESVSGVNDRIVYGGLTAWGEDGPRATEPGMDLLAQAVGGIMGMTGEKGGPPMKAGPPLGDFVASLLMVGGVLAALRARDRDGKGQKISLNLLDGVLSMLPNFVTPYAVTGVPMEAEGTAHPNIVPYQAFQASDKWIVIACPDTPFFLKVAGVLGLDEWITDESYHSNGGRKARRAEIVGRLSEILATRPAAEWLELFAAAGVPCGPVNSLAEAIDDPQTIHNRAIVELSHPTYGSYRVVQNPLRLSRTPVEARSHCPDLGEQTCEILSELGLEQSTVESLIESGVVASTTSSAH